MHGHNFVSVYQVAPKHRLVLIKKHTYHNWNFRVPLFSRSGEETDLTMIPSTLQDFLFVLNLSPNDEVSYLSTSTYKGKAVEDIEVEER